MSESEEPDWLAELAKELFEGAEQFVRDAGRGTTSGVGPVPPLQQRLARAVDAAMRELAPARQPVTHQRTAALTITPIFGATPTATHRRTAALTITPIFGATATVAASLELALSPMRFSGQATVENPPSTETERSIGQILALVLVAIVASGLLGVQGPDRAAVDHYLTVMSVALSVAVLIWNKQNKPK